MLLLLLFNLSGRIEIVQKNYTLEVDLFLMNFDERNIIKLFRKEIWLIDNFLWSAISLLWMYYAKKKNTFSSENLEELVLFI